ncbi:hypothetical protein SAMN06298216_0529 [Spirosomataceae bacterium TFI 002]|nr:hypothetical protein SAMN06298216_0529 [Spirosomataceae bacterium TFI 002]
MERRQFVLTTILGLFSTNSLIANTLKGVDVSNDFVALLGGKDQSLAHKSDALLEKAVLDKSSKFVEMAYTIESNPKQISLENGENLFFYRVVLKHQFLGVLESTILPFKKERNGTVVSLPPISGEFANTLGVAAKQLSSSIGKNELINILIPYQNEHAKHGYFSTPAGSIFFKDVRQNNKSICEIKIYQGDSLVWSKSGIRRQEAKLMS